MLGSSCRHVSVIFAVGEKGTYQDTGFIRAVRKVLVHTPGLGLGGCDRNADFGGVIEQVVSASETFKELGKSPGGNDFDGGLLY